MIEIKNLSEEIDVVKISDAEVEKLHKLYMVTLKSFYSKLYQACTKIYKKYCDDTGNLNFTEFEAYCDDINKLHSSKFSDISIDSYHHYTNVILRKLFIEFDESLTCLSEEIKPFKLSDIEIEKLHKLYMVTMKDTYPEVVKFVSRNFEKLNNIPSSNLLRYFCQLMQQRFDNVDEKQIEILFYLAANKYFMSKGKRKLFIDSNESLNFLSEEINPFKLSDAEVNKLHKLYMVTQKDTYTAIFDSVSRYFKKVNGKIDLIKFVKFRQRQMNKSPLDRKQFDLLFDIATNKWFLDNGMRKFKSNESLDLLSEAINIHKTSDTDIVKLHKLYMVTHKEAYSIIYDEMQKYLSKRYSNDSKYDGYADIGYYRKFLNKLKTKVNIDNEMFTFLRDLASNMYFATNDKGYTRIVY